ncbi:hypothetical protein EZS27_016877 [termite gut metagenome]|uniref:Uncharacterized protein n=1 Tax=termite gut metagenome TaxID=433724 RepID=A0A5J4RN62_9ZZZZ
MKKKKDTIQKNDGKLNVLRNVELQVPNETVSNAVITNLTLVSGGKWVKLIHGNVEDSGEIDMFDVDNAFFGINTFVIDLSKKFLTLNKSNDGDIYFNLNGVLLKRIGYKIDFLNSEDWVDTGTIIPYAINAYTKHTDGTRTFVDNAFTFTINGYTRSLEGNNMETLGYVYNVQTDNTVKLLTSQPTKQYVNGQTEFINFILKDSTHGSGTNFNFGILYTYYTFSNKLITTCLKHQKGKNDLNNINTVKLNPDISSIEEENQKQVGYFTVSLMKEEQVISNELRYNVFSDCFNSVNDFAFLNRLGGWESFNFNGETSQELKTKRNTIFKNQSYSYTVSDQIESVNNVFGEESYSVKSNFISKEIMEWLKEFAMSKAVYELATKRYIVVDDFDISFNSQKSKYQVEMKYHYSDTINNNIQKK